jgi:uncharacterized repeat protein (TIGR01451 family)
MFTTRLAALAAAVAIFALSPSVAAARNCAAPAISGYVYVDANKDGLRQPTEVGIPGSCIELRNSSGAVIGSTVTDANGYYQFSGCLSGVVTIVQTVQPAGYDDGYETRGNHTPIAGSAGGPDAIILRTYGNPLIEKNFGEWLRPVAPPVTPPVAPPTVSAPAAPPPAVATPVTPSAAPAPATSTAPKPRISLRKRAQRKVVAAGSTVKYRIIVKAKGGTAHDVVVCDKLPDHMTYASLGTATLEDGKACWKVGDLTGSLTLTFTAKVDADARPGRLTNNATVTSDVGNSKAKASVRVPERRGVKGKLKRTAAAGVTG